MPTLLDKVVHIWDFNCQWLADDEKVCVAGLPWKHTMTLYVVYILRSDIRDVSH